MIFLDDFKGLRARWICGRLSGRWKHGDVLSNRKLITENLIEGWKVLEANSIRWLVTTSEATGVDDVGGMDVEVPGVASEGWLDTDAWCNAALAPGDLRELDTVCRLEWEPEQRSEMNNMKSLAMTTMSYLNSWHNFSLPFHAFGKFAVACFRTANFFHQRFLDCLTTSALNEETTSMPPLIVL